MACTTYGLFDYENRRQTGGGIIGALLSVGKKVGKKVGKEALEYGKELGKEAVITAVETGVREIASDDDGNGGEYDDQDGGYDGNGGDDEDDDDGYLEDFKERVRLAADVIKNVGGDVLEQAGQVAADIAREHLTAENVAEVLGSIGGGRRGKKRLQKMCKVTGQIVRGGECVAIQTAGGHIVRTKKSEPIMGLDKC